MEGGSGQLIVDPASALHMVPELVLCLAGAPGLLELRVLLNLYQLMPWAVIVPAT